MSGQIKVVGSVLSTEYTGSIAKLYVTGSGTISNIMFGETIEDNGKRLTGSAFVDAHQGEITDLVLPAETVGTYVEGPIGRFKTGTACVIIYYK